MKIGFLGVLTLIFITLKLTGHIVWNWWWVTSPLWLPLAVVGGVFLIVMIAGMMSGFIRDVNKTVSPKEDKPISGWKQRLNEIQRQAELKKRN